MVSCQSMAVAPNYGVINKLGPNEVKSKANTAKVNGGMIMTGKKISSTNSAHFSGGNSNGKAIEMDNTNRIKDELFADRNENIGMNLDGLSSALPLNDLVDPQVFNNHIYDESLKKDNEYDDQILRYHENPSISKSTSVSSKNDNSKSNFYSVLMAGLFGGIGASVLMIFAGVFSFIQTKLMNKYHSYPFNSMASSNDTMRQPLITARDIFGIEEENKQQENPNLTYAGNFI